MNSHQRSVYRCSLQRDNQIVPEWAKPYGGPLRHACNELVLAGRMSPKRRDEILTSQGIRRCKFSKLELNAIASTPTVELTVSVPQDSSWLDYLVAAVSAPIRRLIAAQA